MTDKKVVVAGATGLVGNAAWRHFGGADGCEIVALSRRKPRESAGIFRRVRWLSLQHARVDAAYTCV